MAGSAGSVFKGFGKLLGGLSDLQTGFEAAASLNESAGVLRQQADDVLRKSKINSEIQEKQIPKLQAEQVSAFAKAGVDISTGSPLLAQEEISFNAKRDIQAGLIEAETQAKTLRYEAFKKEKEARSEKRAGVMKAVGSIIGAAGSIAGGG